VIEMAHCPNCGSNNPSEAAYCTNCGQSLTTVLNTRGNASPEKNNSNTTATFNRKFKLTDALNPGGKSGRLQFTALFFVELFIAMAGILLLIYLDSISQTSGGASGVGIGLIVVWELFWYVCLIIAIIRRLHDLGSTGWLILLCLIPVAGIVFLITLFFMPAKKYPVGMPAEFK
jgi:uncharacterized membrane protein YhaH (DUF805 family)